MARFRDRFLHATRHHLYGPLLDGVIVRPTTAARWAAAARELMATGFDRERVDLSAARGDETRARLRAMDASLQRAPLEHRVLLWHGKEIVGVYRGHQEQRGVYYMMTTVLRADHRGRGLYGALLTKVIATARAAGFVALSSRHHADNNAVLVPKLKRGFAITGFEITPRHGLLVHLRHFLDDAERELHRYRVDATSNGGMLRARRWVRDD